MKREQINIGVIGYGVVGRAVAGYYAKKDWCEAVYINDIKGIEPQLIPDRVKISVTDLDRMVLDCRIIFICVPTPRHPANGGCDLRAVYDVHGKLQIAIARKVMGKELEAKTLPIIAIKSTVIPGTCFGLMLGYAHTCSTPEFLTASHADDDMAHPDRIIVGTDSQLIRDTFLAYEERSCDIVFCSPTEAELIKYLSNAYLLYKVAYSEEIRRICKLVGANSQIVSKGIGLDSRMQLSHLEPRGKLDPNSPCLPKDLEAFEQFLHQRNYDAQLFSDTRRQSVSPDYSEVPSEYLKTVKSLLGDLV